MTTLGLKRQRFAAWTLFFILVASLAPTVPSEAVQRLDSAKDAQWINDTFQEGKKYYEAGDYPAALKVWNTLDPYLDEYPSFKRVIEYLKNQIKGNANSTAKPTTSKVVKSTSSPAVTPQRRIDSEMATLQQEKVSRDYTDQKAWLKETFLKGKLAYATGDWTEAMMQWEKVIPYLDPTSQESLLIKKAKIEYDNLKQARRQNESIVAERKANLAAPTGFQETMIEATEKMKIEARNIESRQQSYEKDAVFQEAWLNTTFEKGREHYLQGDYDKAVQEWEKMVFKLDGDPELKKQIESLKEASRAYTRANISYNQSTAAQDQKPKHPASDTMQRFFQDAAAHLSDKAKSAEHNEKDRLSDLTARQDRVNQIFMKGRALYADGKYKEALNEWLLLSAFFETDPSLKETFLSAESSINAYEISRATSTPGDANDFRLKLPDGFLKQLQGAQMELAERSTQMENKRQQTESAIASKRNDVLQTFELGKNLYAQGHVPESIAAWRKILPWVENSQEFEVLIRQIEKSQFDLEKQKKDLSATESKASMAYVSSAELSRILNAANDDLKNQIEAARMEKIQTQSTKSENQARISGILYKANYAYQAGKVQTAIQEWSRMIPFLDEAAEEKALIQDMQENYAEWLKVREAQRNATVEKNIKVDLPIDVKKQLDETNQRLIRETQELSQNQSRLESEVGSRQRELKISSEKGRAYFQAGRLKEALQEWNKLSDSWQEDSNARALVDQALVNLAERDAVLKALNEVKLAKEVRVSLPAETEKSLTEVNKQLITDTAHLRKQYEELDGQKGQVAAAVQFAYDKGMAYFKAGRIKDAADEWKKIVDHFEDSANVRILLEQFDANLQEKTSAKRSLENVLSKQELRVALPEDIRNILTETNQKLIQEAALNKQQLESLSSKSSEQEMTVKSIYDKGRVYLEAGQISEALAEWKKISEYWKDGTKTRVLIEQLSNNLVEKDQAQRLMNQTLRKTEYRAEMPSDLKDLLSKMNQRFIDDAAEYQKKQDLEEKRQAEDKTRIQSIFDKGLAYFQSGRLKESVTEWQKIADHFQDAANIRILLEQFNTNLQEKASAQRSFEDIRSKPEVRISMPEEIRKILLEANQKLNQEADEMRTSSKNMASRYSDQLAQAHSTYEKGVVYLQAGRYREAVDEWKKLSELWVDGAASRVLIEKFDATYQEKLYAEEALKIARSKQAEKFAAPEQLTQLLKEANVHVTQEIESTRAQQARMRAEVQERFMQMDAIWKKGQDLLKQGKYREAVYEWDKLTIYLDEKSAIKPMLDTSKIQLQKMDQAKADTDKYIATEYREQRIPFAEDLGKLLMELNSKIQHQTDEAQKQRLDMEKTVSEKETWLKTTFEKGKTYYEVGKYKEAIEFWSSLQPVIKANPELSSLMAGLMERFQIALKARHEADAAEARRNEKFPVPDELPQLLASMNEKISAKQYEHMSRAEKAEQALQDRSATMTSIYMKGRSLYEAGDYDGALKEWALLPGYLQDEPKIKVAVEQLQKSYQDLQIAQKQAAESEARQNIKFATPEGFTSLLSDAVFKLDKERQEVNLSKSHAEKILAEKQSAVEKIFVEGKSFYAQGKLNEAFLTWRGLSAQVEEGEEVEEALNKAEMSYQSYIQTKDLNQQIVAKKEMKLSAPTELVELLRDANRTLTDQIFDAKNQSAQTSKMLADREKWIDTTFATGHLAYKQGRYKDAVTEWNTLLPFIENGSDLKKALTDFERNLEVSMQSSKILEEAAAKKEIKFAAPDELGVLLMELNEKVKNEAFEASAEKIKAEQSTSEKRKWITETFELGKQFYQQGKFDKAMDEWTKLSPYLEASSGVQKLIDAVKENYAASLEAKKSAVQAAANDYTGLKLPYAQSMTKLLTEADEKLKQDTESYRAKQENMKRTMAEREEWSVTTFNKGKVYYDQGDYDQALNQWERLVPYLEESSDIKEKIESLRENFNTLLAGKEALGDPTQERPVKLEKADTMLAILEEANQKLKGEAKEIASKSDEASRSLRQRKEWIEYNFNKGKTFYDQGNFAKAVEEWAILQPYLGEHPEIKSQIEELKDGFKEGKLAEKVIKEMDEKKKALIPLPEQIEVSSTEPQIPPVVRVPPSQGDPATSSDAPLQLVSGEIVSIDEPQRTLTLKHFSDSGVEETLTVNFDGATKLDGQAVQSLSTIQSGTEIDLRYNPQTSHALYIYVY